MNYTPLQIREVFHLYFLQEFSRRLNPQLFILKGGVNLRLFFKSRRYSEDIDLDVSKASIESVKKQTLKTLELISRPLKTFGISEIISQPLDKAKQTATTQRFKIHLHTQDGSDLFTKIEFSRRGVGKESVFNEVDGEILRAYHLSPLIIPHYSVDVAIKQKIDALAHRTLVQARDVFDLNLLFSFLPKSKKLSLSSSLVKLALEKAGEISFDQYKSQVVPYFSVEDQLAFGLKEVWETIKKSVIINLGKVGLHD